MSGTQDCVIAGGVEVMSTLFIGSTFVGLEQKYGNPYNSEAMQQKYPGETFSQFKGAEIVASTFDISKDEMEDLAVLSHTRAHEATNNGYFKREIVPVTYKDSKTGATLIHDKDEGIRFPIDISKISKLSTLHPEGRITAATSSQLCDGSSAILICNERGLKKLGLKPRAKIISLALAGTDPVMMLAGPIPASEIRSKAHQFGLLVSHLERLNVNANFPTGNVFTKLRTRMLDENLESMLIVRSWAKKDTLRMGVPDYSCS